MKMTFFTTTLFVTSMFLLPKNADAVTCLQMFQKPRVASLPKDLESFPEQSAFIKTLSEQTLDRLKQANYSDVEAQIKVLGYKQAVQETYFQNGSFFIDGGHLVWKKTDGTLVRLVDKDEHPDRGITFTLVSPDGKKIAYSTTLSGSDQHVWYVKSIADSSQHLLSEPILVRMDGFSWGQDSQTVYYSKFSQIDKVVAGVEPINVVRARNLTTGTDQLVFDHGERANYSIYDVDGGKTLIAHRILGPGSGIKALLSLYRGERQKDGSYRWSPFISPNSTMGHFLGVIRKNGQQYAVIHTDQLGKTYGINMVPLMATPQQKPISVVAAKPFLVLHNSQMHGGRLFLEYYNPKTLQSSMTIVNAETGAIEKQLRFSDHGLLNYGSLSLPVAFSGPEVTFKYVDVVGNARVFSYNLKTKAIKAEPNPQVNPFDASRVRVETSSFRSADGKVVRALKMYPVDANGKPLKPKFFFVKSYGMIGIKYSAEPLEAQMVLQRGGVYFVADIRGGAGPNSQWQVEGSRDFYLRYADMKAASEHISEKDPIYSSYGFKAEDVVVMLGRSYNGSGMLNMAALNPQTARLFVSVVPVWDSSYQLRQGRFGVISHSDLFPNVNPQTGALILDKDFYANVEEHNPAHRLTQIPPQKKLIVFTGGRDDRVDQVTIEERFVRTLLAQLGDNFHYIQNPTASHVARWYFEELFTLIDLEFGVATR